MPKRKHQTAWVDTRGHHTPGRISMEAGIPRSYLVETPSGELRQSQAHLRIQNNQEPIRTSGHSYHN